MSFLDYLDEQCKKKSKVKKKTVEVKKPETKYFTKKGDEEKPKDVVESTTMRASTILEGIEDTQPQNNTTAGSKPVLNSNIFGGAVNRACSILD
jgi:hypothetical protein